MFRFKLGFVDTGLYITLFSTPCMIYEHCSDLKHLCVHQVQLTSVISIMKHYRIRVISKAKISAAIYVHLQAQSSIQYKKTSTKHEKYA